MDSREYAWNWFEYHATQRLTTFRYYLVIAGAMALGINTIAAGHNVALIQGAAAIGALISVAFLFLEFRNVELVEVALAALTKLEATETMTELKLVTTDRAHRTKLFRYGLWLKTIYIGCVIAFGVVAVCPSLFVR